VYGLCQFLHGLCELVLIPGKHSLILRPETHGKVQLSVVSLQQLLDLSEGGT
jgi:hypothetical protein